MVAALLLSSLIAGPLATLIMTVFQYLPRLWGGGLYQWIGAMGSFVTGDTSRRAQLIGTLIHFGLGFAFALFYGLIAWGLLAIEYELPPMMIMGGAVNFFSVVIGAAIGLGHGLLVAIMLTIVVIEHHPLPQYRTNFFVVPSAVIGHVMFGTSVMFFHELILRNWLTG